MNSAAVQAIRLLGIIVSAFLIAFTLAAIALIGAGFNFVLSWIMGLYDVPDWLSDRLNAFGVLALGVLIAAGALAGIRDIVKIMIVTFKGDDIHGLMKMIRRTIRNLPLRDMPFAIAYCIVSTTLLWVFDYPTDEWHWDWADRVCPPMDVPANRRESDSTRTQTAPRLWRASS